MLGSLLADRNRCDGVFISFDHAEILQLPTEHNLQRRVMNGRQLNGELQRVLRRFRAVHPDHDRTLVLPQRRTGHVETHLPIAGGQRIGDGILHAGLLIIENAHHGDRNLRLLGQRCRQ